MNWFKHRAASGRNELLAAARASDPAAFGQIVAQWSPPMLQVARCYVDDATIAQQVVCAAWRAIICDGSVARARDPIARCLMLTGQVARTMATTRKSPMAAALRAVDDARFQGPQEPSPGEWREGRAPLPWPERDLLQPTWAVDVAQAVEDLPSLERAVVVLHDTVGLPTGVISSALALRSAEVRRALHIGRARMVATLDAHFRAAEQAV